MIVLQRNLLGHLQRSPSLLGSDAERQGRAARMSSQPPKKTPFQPVPPRKKPPIPSSANTNMTPGRAQGAQAANRLGDSQPSGQNHAASPNPAPAAMQTNISPTVAGAVSISFRSAPATTLKRQFAVHLQDAATTTELAAAFPMQMVPIHSEIERANRMTTPEDFKGMCEDLRTFMGLTVNKVPHQIVKLFRTTLMLLNRYSVEDARDFAFNCNQLYLAHFNKKRARLGGEISNGHSFPKRARHSNIRAEVPNMDNDAKTRRNDTQLDRGVPQVDDSLLKQAVSAMVQDSNPAWAPRGASPERETGAVVQPKKQNAAFHSRMQTHRQAEGTINTKMTMSNLPWKVVPTDDNDRYVLWGLKESGVVPAGRLQRAVAQKLETMLDINHQLHDSQARLLRYLWAFLVAEPVRGTVLCGAMGALRIQQVFAFSAIYMAERRRVVIGKTGSPPRILVVVPKNCETEWAEHISLHNTGPAVVIPNKTSRTDFETLDDWKNNGGVLVCAETFYYSSLSKKTDKQHFCRELLCNPGPNVVFLDQASRFPILRDEVKRLLYRTKTKARVALTGVSMGGNLGTLWQILDWVYPGLLGDVGEFRDIYENRIIMGHRLQSDWRVGVDSYRAASSLFKFAHPVIYPSYGLYDFDKYYSRSVKIDSITVNTNMYPFQRGMYVQLQRHFNKLVDKGEISAFVAAHVLMVAGTSIEALKKLLRGGADFRHRCVASKRLEGQLEKLEPLFVRMYDRLCKETGNGYKIKGSAKFVVARHLFKQCVERKEKMVVFTSSQEVLVELVDYLTKTDRKDGHVSCWNPADSYALRARNVKEFRDFHAAAVFVAPYGPTVECRETMGWADLKVSKVIIMDSGWHAVAEAQCVKRIESRLLGHNGRRVQVLNLVASGTMESMQYANVMKIFKEEKQRLQTTNNETPRYANSWQRSYLVQPEIDQSWFGYEPHHSKRGTVTTDEVTQEVERYCRANTTIDFRRILNLQVGTECTAVRGITAKHNRVLAVSCFAEMCTRAPLHEMELRKAKDEMMMGFERYAQHEEKVADTMSSYCGVKKGKQGLVKMINSDENDAIPQPKFPGLEPHELLTANWLPALWEPYFDLYERGKKFGNANSHR